MAIVADVVVIGGGVTGTSIAYQLARAGVKRIVLVEKGHIASGPTGRSSGIVRQHYTIPTLAAMARDSTRVFQDFARLVGGTAGFVQSGAVFTASSEAAGALRATVAMQRGLGIQAEIVDADALRHLEPQASLEGIALASWEPDAGYADPALTANSYAAAARALGALIRLRTTVSAIERDSRGVTAVETADGPIATRVVINAAGPWADRVAALAGVHLPLLSTRHAVVVIERPPAWRQPTQVWLDIVNGWYYKPEQGPVLIVGGMHIGEEQQADPDHYPATPTYEEVEAHAEAAARRFPVLAEGRAQGGWAGIYDVTPDGQPVLDQVPEVPGFYLAAAFSGHGFKLAPAVGAAVRELVLDGHATTYDLAPFRFSRFAEGRLTRGAYAFSIIG